MKPQDIPLTECLKDTVARFLPHWNDVIAPEVKAGKRVIIVAHGNTIRALVKYLDNVSEKDIVGAEHSHRHSAGLRTGRRPEAAQALLPRRPGEGEQAAAAVAAQARAKSLNAERVHKSGSADFRRRLRCVRSRTVLRSRQRPLPRIELEELRGRIEAVAKAAHRVRGVEAPKPPMRSRDSERAISETNRKLYHLSGQRREGQQLAVQAAGAIARTRGEYRAGAAGAGPAPLPAIPERPVRSDQARPQPRGPQRNRTPVALPRLRFARPRRTASPASRQPCAIWTS